MVKKNYNLMIREEKENTAKAMAKNKNISVKYSTELCREIKGKKVKRVEEYLNNIIKQKEFLPLRKYNKKVAHRKGKAKSNVKSGRYPKKTAMVFLELLNNAVANADYKGLEKEKLKVIHAFASIGFRRQKLQAKGQVAGKTRKSKSTHIELMLKEDSK